MYIESGLFKIMIGINAFIIVFLLQNYFVETKYLITNKEALQWLNVPHRWHQQQITNEILYSLKQLEHLNENGITQSDIRSIESVSMEVFFEASQLNLRMK
jgi:hypothetical protein